MSEQRAWLDVAVVQCPNCGHYYADASWYVAVIGSDIECGKCHGSFNTKKHMVDRVMVRFDIDENGKVSRLEKARRIST